MPRNSATVLPRRQMLASLGATGALLLVGCGDSGGSDDDGGTSTGMPDSTSGATSGSTSGEPPTTGVDGTTDTGDETSSSGDDTTSSDDTSTGPDTGPDCGDADAWATGGTAAMTAKACYPDPFAGGVQACSLICETTAGPCTADTLERQDVSEGLGGLPVRLALLIVDADACQPISGARVEIWHTQRTGVYSGVTPAGMQCYLNDPDAVNHLYFRGTRTAGPDGRVDFDTCFPGWYSGRAIHIHFRVTVGADTHATSQLFFADELAAELFVSHPDYAEFGQPNTDNTTDGVIGGETDLASYVLDTARMPDGAMLASKIIAVRAAPTDPTCILGN